MYGWPGYNAVPGPSMLPETAETGQSIRKLARANLHRSVTVGMAAGFVQANIVILPRELENDFRKFCFQNPQACPLLGTSEPGDPTLPMLGENIDIRTDVPRYRVWKDGELFAQPDDIRSMWRDDLVTFALGCSFSFEEALAAAGVPLRHRDQGTPVPVYLSSIPAKAAGVFRGPLAVTMRPLRAADAIRAIQITTRFPSVHGAPIHIGDPNLIGISNLRDVYEGAPVDVRSDELPVFWACGVTPQAAVLTSKPSFCITHFPGHMLVTDKRNAELAVL